MKNSARLKLSSCLVATVFAVALHSNCVFANDLPDTRQKGDITYITGGIGDEERSAMLAVQHNYNLRILSAAGTSGEYPGDTHITILDNHGTELLSSDVDPFFYAQIPVGHYSVEETSEGQSHKQSIVIGAKKPVTLTFRWK